MTQWWYDADPTTGRQEPAFTPIGGGRLALIEGRGIRHGERFLATFDVKEVKYKGKKQRQMWLVEARRIQRCASGPDAAASENTPLRERLAALEHEQWAHWTRHFLYHLTPENIERWRRQIDTPYDGLSESEKDADREWANRVLELVQPSTVPASEQLGSEATDMGSDSSSAPIRQDPSVEDISSELPVALDD